MAKGRIYICEECGHEWASRKGSGAPTHCPSCHKDNFSPRDTDTVRRTKERYETRKAMEAETALIKEQEEQRRNKEKRIEKEKGINLLGEKEYSHREAMIKTAKISLTEKEHLISLIWKISRDELIKQIAQHEKLNRIKRGIKYGIMGAIVLGILLFVILPISLGVFQKETINSSEIIFPTNDTCQYKEQQDTGKIISYLSDNKGNRYDNSVKVHDFLQMGYLNSPFCDVSFIIENTIEKNVDFNIYYDILYYDHVGVLERMPKELELSLSPLENHVASDSVGTWGYHSCSVDQNSIKIIYQSNSQLESGSDKIYEEVCKKCDSQNCLNDGGSCKQDVQCGSGICNSLDICSKNNSIVCPIGQSKRDNFCVDNIFTKFRKNYFYFAGILFVLIIVTFAFYVYKKEARFT